MLLPGADERDVWTDDRGHLTFEPIASAVDVARKGFALPGLVDAHCHIGLDANGAVAPDVQEEQALTDRDTGALLLRDAGSAADTRWIDDRDDLPRLLRAGRHIARPRRYIRNYGAEVEPEDLVAEVERQVARGDGWVKLVGDWIDRGIGDLAPLWPADVVAAAIARAHELGARVTAHVFSEDALPDLIDAGIDCIEHGTGLTDSTIALMAARGTALVPTRVQIDNFPRYAADGEAKFPSYAAHMRALHARADATLRSAYEAGVPIFTGTDAGGVLPHGLIARETLALHQQVGMSPEDALGAASWRAREWLGFSGLVEGGSADLVLYDQNPLDDLRVLAAPVRIVLRGTVVGRGTRGPEGGSS